ARAAIYPRSPVPLLDELLASNRDAARRAQPATRQATRHHATAPGGREKMISQIPPNQPESPARRSRARPSERASDLVRYENRGVELRGFEPLTPSMRTRCATGLRYSPWNGCQRSKDRRVLALQSPTARFAASEYWSYTWSPIRPEMSMISAPCGA